MFRVYIRVPSCLKVSYQDPDQADLERHSSLFYAIKLLKCKIATLLCRINAFGLSVPAPY